MSLAIACDRLLSGMCLTDEQNDKVTAGQLQLAPFNTTILNIANMNYLDTYNVMNPGFSWGSDIYWMGPLSGSLFTQ